MYNVNKSPHELSLSEVLEDLETYAKYGFGIRKKQLRLLAMTAHKQLTSLRRYVFYTEKLLNEMKSKNGDLPMEKQNWFLDYKSEDICYCGSDCSNKECGRNKVNVIKNSAKSMYWGYSYSDFSGICTSYIPPLCSKENKNRKDGSNANKT